MKGFVKKNLAFALLSVALPVMAFFFLLLPLRKTVLENKNRYLDKQSAYLENNEKYLILKKQSENPDEIRLKAEKIDGLWPADKSVSSFIITLENIANDNGLTFNNLSVSEPKTSGKTKGIKYSSIQFSFDTKGSYDQIKQIVSSLNTADRFNSINQLDLTVREGGIIMKVVGSVYYGK